MTLLHRLRDWFDMSEDSDGGLESLKERVDVVKGDEVDAGVLSNSHSALRF